MVAEERRQDGHYDGDQHVKDQDALESFQWAEEFIQAVKEYLNARP